MDGQNMAYTADNGGGYDQNYDANVDSNVAGSENYQLEDQAQYDSGYSQPMPSPQSTTAGSLFRSEEMALCQLFLQSEAAYACVSELGELGFVQFRDLNPDTNAFQRKFVNEVRRCDEMERKLRFLEKEIKKDDIPMLDADGLIESPTAEELESLEEMLRKHEIEVQGIIQSSETLKKRAIELNELICILQKSEHFFQEHGMVGMGSENGNVVTEKPVDMEAQETFGLQLSFAAGTIYTHKKFIFEKMLWKICRHNAFIRNLGDIEEHDGKNKVFKSVFIVVFQGDIYRDKIKKISDAFEASLYPCPENTANRRDMARQASQSLREINEVMLKTTDSRKKILINVARSIRIWSLKITKSKAIHHFLNMFKIDVKRECLMAECWVPISEILSIKACLGKGAKKCHSIAPPVLHQIHTQETPPTFFRTNKFTSAFQNLINAYGVASYRETNPAVYTIITFPFLFAVMFGDCGHGALMLAFGLYLCVKEKTLETKKIENEIWKIIFSGRYLITIMAVFSIFTGLVYNDIFSKSLNIFGSSFQVDHDKDYIMSRRLAMIDPAQSHIQNESKLLRDIVGTTGYYGTPYTFGLDPIWQVSENKIVFLNAFKMKISIILGVLHMLFGVFLSLANHKYFNNTISIWAEFVPQVIFLCGMFGYLAFLMVIKWWIYFASNDPSEQANSEGCAPSVLITFINMVLFKSEEALAGCGSVYMMGNFQKYLQYLLVLCSVTCIPVMLFGKPFMKLRNNRRNSYLPLNNCNRKEESEFSELMILQTIHTIEYVLGSVSHTASYLRLWALSLAHAQLSDVLWQMVMRLGFVDYWWGGLVLWVIFAAWAGLTVSILVLMEGLSAFLHTLRLHWVEFQSKFYKGDGYLFIPFSFEEILKQAEAEPSG